MELLFQLPILAVGYFSGIAIIPVLKLAGIAFTASPARFWFAIADPLYQD